MDEKNGFYRDKAWDFLLQEIKDIKEIQKKQGDNIASISMKMNWAYGLVAGVTLVFNIAWQIFSERVKRMFSV